MRPVLALDQATRKMGYAIGSADMERPIFGVFKPPLVGARHGVMLGAVRNWLDTQIKVFHIHTVCFEAPFCGANQKSFALVNKLIGVIELVCDDHEIKCVEVTAGEWRKRFIGCTRAPKDIPRKDRRTWLKDAATRACFARTWDVQSDDEADACGILDFVLAQESPSYRERTQREAA